LDDLKIGTGIYYPTPIDSLPSFRRERGMPKTLELTKMVLSLPVHPKVSEEQIQFIADSVNNFFGK
jgi:dTDP-4-amino-4,6-dideoxygalactose transaminase